MFDKKNQSLTAGDGCLVAQAGRDAIINVGYTASDIEGIVKVSLDAFKSGFEAQMETLKGDKLFVEQQLKEAIKALALKSMDVNESSASRSKYEQALELIKEGNTSEAELLFLDIERAEQNNIESSGQKIVEAALHRGALAFMRDTSSSMSAFEKVLELEPENFIAKAHLARLLMRVGKYVKSENLYLQILNAAKANKQYEWVASAYHALGQVSFCKGELEKSLDMQIRAMKILQEMGDLSGVSSVLLEIANVHVGQEDFSPAKKIIEKLIKLAVELDDDGLMARGNAIKGVMYSKLNLYAIAEESLLLSLKFYEKTENLEGMAEAYGNLGVLYKNKSDFVLAEKMYTMSLEIEVKLSRKRGIVSDLVNIANLHNQKGESDLALKRCLEAHDVAVELKSNTTHAAVYASLGGIYFNREEFSLAKENYEISCAFEKAAGNFFGEAKQLVNLSAVLFSLGTKKQALICLKKAKSISKKYKHIKLNKQLNEQIEKFGC